MQVNIINIDSKNSAEPLTLSDDIFARAFNEPLIHQVVVAYKAAARSGNHAQKTRSEVRGGGAKPFRQKGMGRARAGTTRGPIWRTGGVTFAAKPADYSQKVNKKMYKGAICSILSELIRQERLIVVSDFVLDSHKTVNLIEKLAKYALTDVLIIAQAVDDNLYLASRNLHKVDVRDVIGIDPVSLIGYQKVLITADALKQLEETLG